MFACYGQSSKEEEGAGFVTVFIQATQRFAALFYSYNTSAGPLPKYIILRLATEECKSCAKGSLVNIDSNHVEELEEWHAMLLRLVREV